MNETTFIKHTHTHRNKKNLFFSNTNKNTIGGHRLGKEERMTLDRQIKHRHYHILIFFSFNIHTHI